MPPFQIMQIFMLIFMLTYVLSVMLWTKGLRNELKRDGVRITIFFPSTLDTPGLENERKTLPAETAEIEGSSADLFSPDMVSVKSLIKSSRYSITQRFIHHECDSS